MNYESITPGVTDENEAVTPPETLPASDSSTFEAPAVLQPVTPPVLQSTLQPVTPPETELNGVVQKSLKIPAWLAKNLELEAAASGIPFNTHINNILMNRERMEEAAKDLVAKYQTAIDQNNTLVKKCKELELEKADLLRHLQVTSTDAPKLEALSNVLEALIDDVANTTTYTKEGLTAHVQELFNFYQIPE